MGMHAGPKFTLRVLFAIIGLTLSLTAAAVPRPTLTADQDPALVLDPATCDQLLPPTGTGFLIPIPPQVPGELLQIPDPQAAGAPNLRITCLEFDHTHYFMGDQWTATMMVTNFGNAASGAFTVQGWLCRTMSGGITFACQGNLGRNQQTPAVDNNGLGPGQSRLYQSPAANFGLLPTDDPAG